MTGRTHTRAVALWLPLVLGATKEPMNYMACASRQMAIMSERLLRPECKVLGDVDPGTAKQLLVRDALEPITKQGLTLHPCKSDADWTRYESFRVQVEQAFGLDEFEARSLVRSTRERGKCIGLSLWLAGAETSDPVGAVAAFRPSSSHPQFARLQEVDVFPAWRGRGLGRALLEGIRQELCATGVRWLLIGADEDDWPLSWYRRLGFRDLARVSTGSPAESMKHPALLGGS
jgi:GNAT superfamily N-acetyltransferase